MNRFLALVATALVASACASGASGTTGAGSPPSRQPAGRPTTTRSIGAQTPAPTPSHASDDPSPSPEPTGEGGGSAAGEDDLRTFAYATTDETALAAELTSLTVTVVELQADLAARDLDASKADARTLLDQAETLGGDAEDSERRQRPLEPADPDLAAARGDAIDAFGLTAEYASSVTDIADAVLTGQLADLPTLVQEAAELAGTSDDLTQAYADLNAELAAWAQANPADAARALARYGSD